MSKGVIMASNGNFTNNMICKLNNDIDIEIPIEDVIFTSTDLWDMCDEFIIVEKLPNGVIEIYDKFRKSQGYEFTRTFGDLLLIGNKNIRAFGLYNRSSQWDEDVIAELDYKFPINADSLYLTDYDSSKW